MHTHVPDIAVLDLAMPGMSGYALASLIRQDLRYQGVKLVALSGFGQPNDRERSIASGFSQHLTKPVDMSALVDLLLPMVQSTARG
jgi:CheY-like chemotaxis protein